MKKLRLLMHHVGMMLAILIVLMACSSEKENYLSSLPANSMMVFKLNIPQLVHKSNVLNNSLAQGMFTQLEQEVPTSFKEKYAEIKKNPSACGLDLKKPLAMALSMTDINNPKVVAVLPIKDIKKWEELLEGIAENDDNISLNEVASGVKEIAMEGEELLQCVYNESRVVFSMGVDAVSLVSQKMEQSMLAHPHFSDFALSTQDGAMYLDYGSFTESLAEQLPSSSIPNNWQLLKDCALFGELNFEEGRVVASSKVYASKELADYQREMISNPSGKFLGLVPADSYLVFSSAIKNFYKQLKSLGEEAAYQLATILAPYGLTLEMLNVLEGDVMAGVYSDSTLGIPGVVLAMECKDRSVYEALREGMNAPAEEGKNSFEIPFLGYCVTYVDDAVIVAPKPLFEQCLAAGNIGELEENLKDSPRADILKKGALILDFQSISDNPLWSQFASSREVKAMHIVCSELDELIIQMDSPTMVSGELTLKNPDKNALEQFITIALAVAMSAR